MEFFEFAGGATNSLLHTLLARCWCKSSGEQSRFRGMPSSKGQWATPSSWCRAAIVFLFSLSSVVVVVVVVAVDDDDDVDVDVDVVVVVVVGWLDLQVCLGMRRFC
eukprot:5560022-Amphidinium_carterae.1